MKSIQMPAGEPEATSLEWKLHSPQVSDAQLIQELLEAYFDQLLQLAIAEKNEPSRAYLSACQGLAAAVYQRQRYWGEPPLQDWVLQHVRRALAEAEDTASLLRGGESPPGSDQNATRVEIERCLDRMRRRARRLVLVRHGFLAGAGLAVVILLLWLAGFNQLLPATTPEDRVRFYYPYITRPGDTLSSIAKTAGVHASDIYSDPGTSATETLSPGRIYWIPSLKLPWWQNLLYRYPAVPPPPLTIKSSPAAIKRRIQENPRYWQTLWADQVRIQYGPPGYVAPPVAADRFQTWIRKPDQGLLLQGDLSGYTLQDAWVYDGNRIYFKDEADSVALTQFLSADVRKYEVSKLVSPFIPDFLKGSWTVQVIGMEEVAGRPALVVDAVDSEGQRQARLWVDTRLGAVLALRLYGLAASGTGNQPVLKDMVTLAVQFNVKIKDATFDPNTVTRKLAKDYTGAPIEQTGLPSLPFLKYAPDPAAHNPGFAQPPAGFEPDQSQLTLRLEPLPGDSPFDFQTQDGEPAFQYRSIDVYGDEFYLGTQTFQLAGKPFLASCARSPDGSLVAFAGSSATFGVSWFRMSDPQLVHPIPGRYYTLGEYAFSPSSRRLAFFGCSGEDLTLICGLNLLDFETEQVTPFVDLGDSLVQWLGWSPDGEYLAAILVRQGSPNPDQEAGLKVFQVSSAQPVYSGPYNLYSDQAAPDAPTRAWGAAFQPQLAPLKGCAQP